MTATELLDFVTKAGIILEAHGDQLTVDAPTGVVTPDLRRQLVQQKPALLGLLVHPRAFVALKNGPILPIEVIELALDLERRGIPLKTDADHQFILERDPRLTEDDYAAIARWRHHLGAIVEYQPPEIG